jgi:dolichyl-phosphate beta-glucosyltransferase
VAPLTAPVRPASADAPRVEARARGRSLTVVIPAYNEEARLPRGIRAVHAYLRERAYDGEVLVVDDGSVDGTHEAAKALAAELPGLRVLRLPRNAGKGAAVRAGMLAATKENVLFSDADLSTPIEEVERFWPSRDQGCEVVIASRAMARSRILEAQSAPRRLMGRVFNALLPLAGLRGIRDSQCGFKLFSARAARRLFGELRTDGFAFDVEVLLRARRARLKIAEIPVQWRNDPLSRIRPVRDALGMFLEILRIRSRM